MRLPILDGNELLDDIVGYLGVLNREYRVSVHGVEQVLGPYFSACSPTTRTRIPRVSTPRLAACACATAASALPSPMPGSAANALARAISAWRNTSFQFP